MTPRDYFEMVPEFYMKNRGLILKQFLKLANFEQT